MDTLSIVSLEGSWDAAINDRRLKLAAAAFRQRNADFIISSGTYEPGSSVSDCAGVRRLGERNAYTLRDVYYLDPAVIIPAYAFPFEFTYTIIEAFGNACVIGWLMSGFEMRSELGRVDFLPVSSGVHCRRVQILNVRACQALKQFNVEATVKRQQPSGPGERHSIENEAVKLRELTWAGGVIATGRWFHGDEEWSFDDQKLMRATMAAMIKTVLPGLGEDKIRRIAGAESMSRRYEIMQMLCEISAKTKSVRRRLIAFLQESHDSSREHSNKLARRGSRNPSKKNQLPRRWLKPTD
jgi:hypothetical protein